MYVFAKWVQHKNGKWKMHLKYFQTSDRTSWTRLIVVFCLYKDNLSIGHLISLCRTIICQRIRNSNIRLIFKPITAHSSAVLTAELSCDWLKDKQQVGNLNVLSYDCKTKRKQMSSALENCYKAFWPGRWSECWDNF